MATGIPQINTVQAVRQSPIFLNHITSHQRAPVEPRQSQTGRVPMGQCCIAAMSDDLRDSAFESIKAWRPSNILSPASNGSVQQHKAGHELACDMLRRRMSQLQQSLPPGVAAGEASEQHWCSLQQYRRMRRHSQRKQHRQRGAPEPLAPSSRRLPCQRMPPDRLVILSFISRTACITSSILNEHFDRALASLH